MAELVSIKRNVDVSPGQAAPAVFHCSQGDVGSKIILGLLNNGTAYAIPSGVTVTIEGSESNGSIFTPISATVSGSDITFYLTGEMTAVAGPAICQAVLKSGSNILGTANFTLEVESSPMGADAPPVFTDAGWTWMLNKLTTEFVPALDDNIIDAIDSKADQSDLTALSNTVAGHTGSITVLNNTVNTLNRSVAENRQNIATKLDKNQGTANAGKYLKVGAGGNVETAGLDKTLSIADKAADAKAVGDELDVLKAEMGDNFGLLSGVNLNGLTSPVEESGINYSYDAERCMYHIQGTLASNTWSSYNLFVEDHGLCGLEAGKKYHMALREELNGKDSTAVVEVYYNTTTSGKANWKFYISIYSGTVSNFIVPENANGLLFRLCERVAGDYDLYAALECVPDTMFTPYMAYIAGSNPNAIAIRDTPKLPEGQETLTCADAVENGVYFNSVTRGVSTFSDFPLNPVPGWLYSYHFGGNDIQFAVGWSAPYMVMYRTAAFGKWHDWKQLCDTVENYLPGCDLDTVLTGNHFYLLIDSETYENMPLDSLKVGFLEVKQSANWGKQIFYALREGKSWVRTFSDGEVDASGWILSEGGGGNTYDITQQINRDSFTNTYNITANPAITTDTNNYLRAVDNELTAEADATDMTASIMAMLNSTGHCKLGPGTFYVSGNIDMPNGSMIEGCGDKTIIRLLASVSSGYILRLRQYNTVKDIHFSGGKIEPTDLYTQADDMGSRHGIYMVANADEKETAAPRCLQCVITNCWFDNFDGSAFYAHNTGGGIHNSVIFSDSHIEHCRVGLNLDYYCEYAKYSHLVIYQCYYACINNGGNNVFIGCTFHGVVGWLTDNSANDKSNNQHGSCIGCTFNHIDNMNNPSVLGNGKAVHIINGVAGFIFTGCQLWYGNVYIENSMGVQFSDCLFGNNRIKIEVTGSYPAFFMDNIFWTAPTLNVIPSCKFKNNYLRSGAEVTP